MSWAEDMMRWWLAWSSDVLKSPVLDDSGHFMPFFQYHYDEPLGRLLWGPY